MSSRKSHTKSRSGCSDCKRRKIKCDESRPECSNCRKHSISCSFVNESSSSEKRTKPDTLQPNGTVSSTPNSHSSGAGGRIDVENGLPDLNLSDLELLHNFTASTSATMSHSPILRTLWRVNVPKLGFENDYVMRGILAISALHMARFTTSKKDFYFHIAESQHAAGLRLASPIIPHISDENCSAMYIFSILTSFYVLASRHQSTDATPDAGLADWMFLLRSTLSIVEVSWSSLGPGSLGPMFQIGKQRIEMRDSNTSMHPQLEELDDFCRREVSDVAEREIYATTITELSKSFRMIYGRSAGDYEIDWLDPKLSKRRGSASLFVLGTGPVRQCEHECEHPNTDAIQMADDDYNSTIESFRRHADSPGRPNSATSGSHLLPSIPHNLFRKALKPDMTVGNYKLYRYDPSLPAAIVFVVLFIIATGAHVYQMVKYRTWYFVPFVIGGFFEWIGYVGRGVNATQSPNWTTGPYIVQSLLLLLAPVFFAATIYMVLGRIIRLTDGEALSSVRSRWITKLFVAGDILSFLTQSGGGGMLAAANTTTQQNLGQDVIIGGLGLQIIFFSAFIVVAGNFHFRMVRGPTQSASGVRWQRMLCVLYIGSGLIMARNVFRIIEYIMGNDGYLLRHEIFPYFFDALLMLGVMVVFGIWHPSRVLDERGETVGRRLGSPSEADGTPLRVVDAGKSMP